MYEPTKWWRVMRGNVVWAETSSEHDARSRMEPGDVLERLYTKSVNVWRIMDEKPPRKPKD